VVIDVKKKERHTDENKGSTYGIIGTKNGGREFLVTKRITESDKE